MAPTESFRTIKTRIAGSWTTTSCVHCRTSVEYPSPSASTSSSTSNGTAAPPPIDEPFNLECASCGKSWIVRPVKAKQPPGKRRIGTDEKPLDLSYYELLGLPPSCSTEDIKKAYRRLNPDDSTAGEKFKEIAIAYATLSDEGLRHTYNEFGKSKSDGGGGEDAPVDPEAIFSQLFGGEAFQDIIGTISLGSEMKSAMQLSTDEEEAGEKDGIPPGTPLDKSGKPILSAAQQEEVARKKAIKDAAEKKVNEAKAKAREERVAKLVERLRNQLALFTEQAEGEEDAQTAAGVKAMWTIKAEELKQESYGVDLLQTVGFVYSSKSKHYLASTGPIPFGLGGWFHSARSTVHIVNETVSTVRSAYALKEVFDKLAAAEQSGLSDEKKKELEDKAAQMGIHALFKGAKLEVESVIREVCDRLLSEENVSVPDLRKRAVAMGLLGGVFEAVKKEPGSGGNPLLEAMAGGASAGGAKEGKR